MKLDYPIVFIFCEAEFSFWLARSACFLKDSRTHVSKLLCEEVGKFYAIVPDLQFSLLV